MSSLKTHLRNRFNCSVSEVGFKDKRGRSQLAVCLVSDESAHVNKQLKEIIRFSLTHHLASLDNYTFEHL